MSSWFGCLISETLVDDRETSLAGLVTSYRLEKRVWDLAEGDSLENHAQFRLTEM